MINNKYLSTNGWNNYRLGFNPGQLIHWQSVPLPIQLDDTRHIQSAINVIIVKEDGIVIF